MRSPPSILPFVTNAPLYALHTHRKVAIVLEELGLTYESIYLDFNKGEQKEPRHTNLNPNGRIPTLVDHHNGDYTIWESDAILLYLADKYDKENRLSVADDKAKYSLIQWLFFQASGQGCVSLPPLIPILARADTRHGDAARTSARRSGS